MADSESWPKYLGILVFGGIVLIAALHVLGVIDLTGGGGGGVVTVPGVPSAPSAPGFQWPDWLKLPPYRAPQPGAGPAEQAAGGLASNIGLVIVAFVLVGLLGGGILGRRVWKAKGWTLFKKRETRPYPPPGWEGKRTGIRERMGAFMDEEARRWTAWEKYERAKQEAKAKGKGRLAKFWEEEQRRMHELKMHYRAVRAGPKTVPVSVVETATAKAGKGPAYEGREAKFDYKFEARLLPKDIESAWLKAKNPKRRAIFIDETLLPKGVKHGIPVLINYNGSDVTVEVRGKEMFHRFAAYLDPNFIYIPSWLNEEVAELPEGFCYLSLPFRIKRGIKNRLLDLMVVTLVEDENDLEGVRQIINACRTYFGEYKVIVANGSRSDIADALNEEINYGDVDVVQHGHSDKKYFGYSAGILHALENYKFRFLLKIDPDVLIANGENFIRTLEGALDKKTKFGGHRIGAIGCYTKDCKLEKHPDESATIESLTSLGTGGERKDGYHFAKLLGKKYADFADYRLQSKCFAASRLCLEVMKSKKYLGRTELAPVEASDDWIFSILIKAAGFEIRNACSNRGPFAIKETEIHKVYIINPARNPEIKVVGPIGFSGDGEALRRVYSKKRQHYSMSVFKPHFSETRRVGFHRPPRASSIAKTALPPAQVAETYYPIIFFEGLEQELAAEETKKPPEMPAPGGELPPPPMTFVEPPVEPPKPEEAPPEPPKDAAYYNEQGVAAARLGEFSKALEMFAKSLEINPNFPWALLNMGEVLRHQGRFSDAFKYYIQLLQLDENNIVAHTGLGILQMELGNYSDAEKSFNRAFSIDDSFHWALYGRGQLSYKLGKYQEATTYFKKALRIRKNDINALCGMAAAMIENVPLILDAAPVLEQVLQMQPNNGWAWYLKGEISRKLADAEKKKDIKLAEDEYREAIRCYGKATEDPRNAVWAWTQKGKCYVELAEFHPARSEGRTSNITESNKCFNKALELDPNFPEAIYARAISLMRLSGATVRAAPTVIKLLDRAVELYGKQKNEKGKRKAMEAHRQVYEYVGKSQEE